MKSRTLFSKQIDELESTDITKKPTVSVFTQSTQPPVQNVQNTKNVIKEDQGPHIVTTSAVVEEKLVDVKPTIVIQKNVEDFKEDSKHDVTFTSQGTYSFAS